MLKFIKDLLTTGTFTKKQAEQAVSKYLKDPKNFNEESLSELIVASMLEEEEVKETKKETKPIAKPEIKPIANQRKVLNVITKTKPAKSAEPAGPAKSAKSAEPAKPAKPAEPAKSAKPAAPCESADPCESSDPAKSAFSNVALPSPQPEQQTPPVKPVSWWESPDRSPLPDTSSKAEPVSKWTTITKKNPVFEKAKSPEIKPARSQKKLTFESNSEFQDWINEQIRQIEFARSERGEEPIYDLEGQSSRNVIFGIPLGFGFIDKYNTTKFYPININGTIIKYPVTSRDPDGNFRPGWPVDKDGYVKFQVKSQFYHRINHETFKWEHFDSFLNTDDEIEFEQITKEELINRLIANRSA
jgi:hypothetical protein